MTDEEKDKLWAEEMELERQRYEKRRKYFAENPEAALAEQREILFDPLCQRMNNRIDDEDNDFIECTIVGISQNCGERFQNVMSHLHEGSLLLLLPELENKHDKNAIAVYDSEGRIGYVAAKETASIRSSLSEFGYTECYVMRKFKNSLLVQLEYVSEEPLLDEFTENMQSEFTVDEETEKKHRAGCVWSLLDGDAPKEEIEHWAERYGIDYDIAMKWKDYWLDLKAQSPKNSNPKKKEIQDTKDLLTTEEMDSDLIALKLWKGEREPQNEWEKKVKEEFDEMRRQGKVPDVSWFE